MGSRFLQALYEGNDSRYFKDGHIDRDRLRKEARRDAEYYRPSIWLGVEQEAVRGLNFDDYMKLQEAASESQQAMYELITSAAQNGVIKAFNVILESKKDNGGQPPTGGE